MLHLVTTQAAYCRLHGAGSTAESARGNAANPYASLLGAYGLAAFFCLHVSQSVKTTLRGNDDEAGYRIVAQRKLESLVGVLPVFRYGIYGVGDVRAAGAVRFQAIVAVADSGRTVGRRARTQRLDRARDTRQPVSIR